MNDTTHSSGEDGAKAPSPAGPPRGAREVAAELAAEAGSTVLSGPDIHAELQKALLTVADAEAVIARSVEEAAPAVADGYKEVANLEAQLESVRAALDLERGSSRSMRVILPIMAL